MDKNEIRSQLEHIAQLADEALEQLTTSETFPEDVPFIDSVLKQSTHDIETCAQNIRHNL